MRVLPIVFVVLLSAILIAAPAPGGGWDPWAFRVRVAYTDHDNPYAPAAIADRLARVRLVVEDILGERIDIAGVEVRVVDPFLAADRAFAEHYPHLQDVTAEDYDPSTFVKGEYQSMTRALSRAAWYDATTEEITLHPWNVEFVGAANLDATLDLVLAHELVHAWQDRNHGVFEYEGVLHTDEQELARSAVIEGTAEFVAREVARRRGTPQAFDRLLEVRDGESAGSAQSGVATGLMRWARWVYGEGLRFVARAHETWGAPVTWQRLFEDRPSTVFAIEHPDVWIEGRAGAIFDLKGWSDRLEQALESGASDDAVHHTPLLSSDLATRLEHAGTSKDASPWSACQGGVLLGGKRASGALAGATFVLRLWRFPLQAQAEDARDDLVRGTHERGIHAWTGGETETTDAPPLVRPGSAGGTAYTSVGLDAASAGSVPGFPKLRLDKEAHCFEGTWSVRVHGSTLLEAFCVREGCAPALLDLLDLAVRLAEEEAREEAATAPPDGQASRLRWLNERERGAGAWIAALTDGSDEEVEMGPLLVAALRHPDDDVRRYALGALAGERIKPSPFSAEVPGLIVQATRHDTAAMRCVALRAARPLSAEVFFEKEDLERLAHDPSPAVRTALANASDLFRQGTRHVRRTLARDPHPIVRSAAAVGPDEQKDNGLRFAEQLIESFSEHKPAADGSSARLAEKIRDLRDPAKRQESAFWLRQGGYDLEPAREPLLAMLEHPHWRSQVLLILAANGLDLSEDLVERVEAWQTSHDPSVRAGATALLLTACPDDARHLEAAKAAWAEVSQHHRRVLLAAAIQQHPESDVAADLYRRAIRSPFTFERTPALALEVPDAFLARQADLILEALDEVGPDMAFVYWSAFYSCVFLDDLDQLTRIFDVLAKHLHRWCERDRLPVIRAGYGVWDSLLEIVQGDVVAALDRALVRDDSPVLRLGLAHLRINVDEEEYPETPAVKRVVDRLLSLEPFPLDGGLDGEEECFSELAYREDIEPRLVEAVLRRAAARGGMAGTVGDFLEDAPNRTAIALLLVHELLKTGTTGSVSVAMEVLEAGGGHSRFLEPLIRSRLDSALPSWRARFESWLERVP